MDDKKKYEMALERAKEELGSGCFNRGSIEYIFPELKKESESEDEQIRKELISFVRNDGWKFIKLTKEEKKSWIAWLEKQNEKPTTISVDKMVDEFEHSKVISRGIPSLAEVDAYRKGVTDAFSKILIREEKDC